MLLIFATRYDEVTNRTHLIARRLLDRATELSIPSLALFEGRATREELSAAFKPSPEIVSFFVHGDADGRLLTQDHEPCWSNDNIPVIGASAIIAHACGAMKWLADQIDFLRVGMIAGYYVDLMQPANGSELFWQSYGEIHCFLPEAFYPGGQTEEVRREFYKLCTRHFEYLNKNGAGLIELLAIQQSRDRLEIIVADSSDEK